MALAMTSFAGASLKAATTTVAKARIPSLPPSTRVQHTLYYSSALFTSTLHGSHARRIFKYSPDPASYHYDRSCAVVVHSHIRLFLLA